MPRTARIKKDDAIYHIMIRSITEVPLFKKHKDKATYLRQMREYQKVYRFKVYAYCIMTNHAHFIIDSNGADISKIMHGLNFKYAMTFNRIHKRKGHLFQDRFKSKVVNSQRYLLTLTAYIHNNPLKISGFEHCPEKYKYSSLRVYLGLARDETGLLDEEYIKKMFGKSMDQNREEYMKFVYICDEKKLKDEVEFKNEKMEYSSGRKILVRDCDPEQILEFIANETGIKKVMLHVKNNRNAKEGRALAALLMRSFCNYGCNDICKVLGNITQSRVSKLCSIAVDKISSEDMYSDIVEKFIHNQYVKAS